MCGIAGLVDFLGAPPGAAELSTLRDSLAHRGPDDAGQFVLGPVALGHRRLAIIDLSPLGHQPMSNEDGTIWTVFNGEIYNFREVRDRLEARGHAFRSRTDSEVIVHAYEEWGTECVNHFVGMFAFVIYDGRPGSDGGRVFLARDRLGVKPLHYALDGSRLVFASEAQAIYRYVRPEAGRIDRDALRYFLAFGYAPPDRSFIQGVNKLPPAHALLYDRSGLRSWRYWQVSFRPQHTGSLEQQLEELDQRFRLAVTRRLVSDVPLGCFLSGGIDSGLVAAVAAQTVGKPLRTFSVGFGGAAAADDERPLARLVAERYGTRHEELVVHPEDSEPLAGIVYHVGEPLADVSILPTFQMCRLARQHITVALSGDGGDESFAGYRNVHASFLAEALRRRSPRSFHQTMRWLACEGHLARFGGPARRVGSWWSQYVERPVREQYDLSNHWDQRWQDALLAPTWPLERSSTRPLEVVGDVLDHAANLSDAEAHLHVDLHLRLPGNYLPKVDIASGMAALEVRSPFLDHELVEFAAGLPIGRKLLGWRQKGLLRRLARRYLPPELIDQPKRGFSPPLARWLRTSWRPFLLDLVAGSLASRPDLFRRELVHRVVHEHLDGQRDHGQRLWSLICLEIWWQIFVDRSLEPGDTPWASTTSLSRS